MLLDGSTGDEIERIMQGEMQSSTPSTRTAVCARLPKFAGNGIDRNAVGPVQMLGN